MHMCTYMFPSSWWLVDVGKVVGARLARGSATQDLEPFYLYHESEVCVQGHIMHIHIYRPEILNKSINRYQFSIQS